MARKNEIQKTSYFKLFWIWPASQQQQQKVYSEQQSPEWEPLLTYFGLQCQKYMVRFQSPKVKEEKESICSWLESFGVNLKKCVKCIF